MKKYPLTEYRAEGKGSMRVRLPIRKVMALIRLINGRRASPTREQGKGKTE